MEKDLFRKRNEFLRVAWTLLGNAMLSACVPDAVKASKTIDPTGTARTMNSNPKDLIGNETQTFTYKDRFIVNGIDTANTPFKIYIDEDFRRLLGHFFDFNLIYTGDFPSLSLTGPALTQPGQFDQFESARHNHADGNPVIVIPVDLPANPSFGTKHAIYSTHSRQFLVPGDLSMEIVTWLSKNPEKKADLLSQKVKFQYDENTFEAQVVNATYIKESYWEGLESATPWMEYPGEGVIFASSELLGIPEEVTSSLGKDEFLITIVGCLPIEPFEEVVNKNNPGKAYILNNYNRALVTYKLRPKNGDK